MAFSMKQVVAWTLVILGYGQLAVTDDIGTRIAYLETLAAKVELSAYSNADKLEKLKFRVQEDDTRLHGEKVRQVADPNIGFDARVFGSNTQLGDQQTIRFNIAHVNQGAGYDTASGRFTCPQPGLYQFASTIPSKLNGTMECEMMMDNVQVGRFRANEPGLDQATQVVVLECMDGQQVWIRHLSGANDTAFLTIAHHTLSFSGHLISVL